MHHVDRKQIPKNEISYSHDISAYHLPHMNNGILNPLPALLYDGKKITSLVMHALGVVHRHLVVWSIDRI